MGMVFRRIRFSQNVICAVLLFLIGLTGCRLQSEISGNGTIQSQSGRFFCTPQAECQIEVQDANFTEIFIAVPAPGWEFQGWSSEKRTLCLGKQGPCSFDMTTIKNTEFERELVDADVTLFIRPIFRRASGGTIFGVGGTSGILTNSGAANLVIDLLRQSGLNRDPTQTPPTAQERFLLNDFDFSRTAAGRLTNTYNRSQGQLKRIAQLRDSVPFFVELDLRINPAVSGVGGGHAGHEYFSVDGRFLDIMSEVANFYALSASGRTFDNPVFAIDRIVAFHNQNVGGPSLYCCYPFDVLTPAERNISDRNFWSMAGAIAYHEFAHFYLYHALDGLRANLDISGLIRYSSVNEDDADFIAGALARKANLDPEFGRLMFDLLFFYMLQRQGLVFSIQQVVNNPQVQLYQSSPNYSPLILRKENFMRGFNLYR